MQKFLLATRNAGKVREMQRLFAEASMAAEVIGLDAFPHLEDVEENGATFAENALIKARYAAKESKIAAIADDSGICVDALNGMPGIYSARWSGKHGDDRANLELLLSQIAHVPVERRTAHFRCAVALVYPDGRELVVEGRMDGRVIDAPRGQGGFGYDPIFCAHGSDRTSAELTPEEKDAVSHRGNAMRALIAQLRAQ